MSEAVRYYAREPPRESYEPRDNRNRKETSEDSGVESGHSLENNGNDSQTDSGSEHSVHDKESAENNVNIIEVNQEKSSDDGKMLVCHL